MALLEDVEDVPMEEQPSSMSKSDEKDASQAANGHDENDKPNDEGGSDDDENEEEYEIERILDAKRGMFADVRIHLHYCVPIRSFANTTEMPNPLSDNVKSTRFSRVRWAILSNGRDTVPKTIAG